MCPSLQVHTHTHTRWHTDTLDEPWPRNTTDAAKKKEERRKSESYKVWTSYSTLFLGFFPSCNFFLISLLHLSSPLSQDSQRERQKKRPIHQWDLMLPHPAQHLYHMVYIINNLYEPVYWLKHKSNMLLLLEPQTPNVDILDIVFILLFSACNCTTMLKKKKLLRMYISLAEKWYLNAWWQRV